ncbi:RSP_7527 family protein [Pelagibius marinus]|uniref:RSP_7527 family protein n=1 Tax=Pelagibius marinus TaxID=2762760 RepID=UPI0018721AE8|nr:hypothetical protein [Pelagibius marinus]
MQHQSQDLSKGPNAGKTGIYLSSDKVITAEEIERHIAKGKRMQAEAIAALLSSAFRRLTTLFPPRHAQTPVREEHLSRA